MIIKKAVIAAAGPDQRHLPLQTITSASGKSQTVLANILEEVFEAGISKAAVIVAEGDAKAYTRAAGGFAEKTTFITQSEPLGYGHAVLQARDFVGDDAFLLMVSDHLYIANSGKSCVQQLLETASANNCSISAVQSTHESQLPYYGTVGGSRVPGVDDLYDITKVVEKPTPTLAEQELIIPGLRSARYLCFFGMHVLTADAIDILATRAEGLQAGEKLGLTATLEHLAHTGKYLAYQVDGRRYNIAEDHGLLISEMALALAGPSRDTVLTKLVELLASSPTR